MTNKELHLHQMLERLADSPQSICFVSGNFNIIHPGHLRFLMFAAEQADLLVVGLNDMSYSKGAFISNEERLLGLNALQFVDHILMINDNLEDVISALKPDFIVKGKEFENRDNKELNLTKEYGGKLLFSSGERTFSSRALLLSDTHSMKKNSDAIDAFLSRKHIETENLFTHIDAFKKLKVTVIGDIIVDEYQECDPIGMSQEDPTIAVSPVQSFKFLGGAGIVAAHAANLGADVQFISVTGDDSLAEFARSKLQEYQVQYHLCRDASRPTTHKLRYRAKDKTLLRVNNCRTHHISAELIEELLKYFEEACSQSDLVIFSDFSYGLLCPNFIARISQYCKINQIPVVADSQTSSQMGDLNKFHDLLLTTPTEIEARGAVKDDKSGLARICNDLGEQLNAQNVIITLGSEGILINHRDQDIWKTDRLPAIADSAIDTAGAGDALFVTTALSLSSGASIWEAALLGGIAASIQVNVKGNKPIHKQSLLAWLHKFST